MQNEYPFRYRKRLVNFLFEVFFCHFFAQNLDNCHNLRQNLDAMSEFCVQEIFTQTMQKVWSIMISSANV